MRHTLVALLLLAASLSAADKPNIVLILCDDLGINDLSCYGRKDQPTPNLDRLASEGVRFTNSYCAQPICSASRAGLMTGKSPTRLHLTNFLPGRADAKSQLLRQPIIEGQLPLEEVTIAERLHDAGYATGHIGKWHLGNAGFGPKEQGFDFTYAGKANTKPSATEGSKGEYDLTAHAEQWLDEHKDQPFFLYLAHNTPHIPFAALPEDIARHQGAFNPTYAAVIEHLDKCVGRIMAKIDGLGLREKTIFIFNSDNGGLHVLEFPGTPSTHNTPYRAGKGYVYEGGLRVPLIVRWPGVIKPAWVSDTPVVSLDLIPTLLEAAGVDLKNVGPLDGVSLTKFLQGGELPARPLFWHFPNYTNQGGRPAGAVREANWKLIDNYEDGKAALFDLSKDPGEAHDLAAQESARVAEMQGKLAAWRVSVGAQECTANPEADPSLNRQLYVDHDPSKLIAGTRTAAEIETEWADWRKTMNEVVKGTRAQVTLPTGDVRLLAKDATVHGEKLRYEPQPQKNTLGFWVNPADWASWEFDTPKAGKYEVEVLQGCGNDGGAQVDIEVAGQIVHFTVIGTGHFQNFAQRTIGTVDLPAGKQTLAVKPKTKPGNAVMDLRRVVLRPVP